MIKEPRDITRGIEFARRVEGIRGVVIIVHDQIGAWGDVRLVDVGD